MIFDWQLGKLRPSAAPLVFTRAFMSRMGLTPLEHQLAAADDCQLRTLPLALNTMEAILQRDVPDNIKRAEAQLQQSVELPDISQHLVSHRAASPPRFLAMSSTPSIADLFTANELSQLELIEWDFSPWPAVQAWRQYMAALPHYDQVHSIHARALAALRAEREQQAQQTAAAGARE